MHKGTLIVAEDGDVAGMVDGDVLVRAGCHARISGMVSGDVIVEQGATAQVSGMVSGSVVGAGATVTGMVRGRR